MCQLIYWMMGKGKYIEIMRGYSVNKQDVAEISTEKWHASYM